MSLPFLVALLVSLAAASAVLLQSLLALCVPFCTSCCGARGVQRTMHSRVMQTVLDMRDAAVTAATLGVWMTTPSAINAVVTSVVTTVQDSDGEWRLASDFSLINLEWRPLVLTMAFAAVALYMLLPPLMLWRVYSRTHAASAGNYQVRGAMGEQVHGGLAAQSPGMWTSLGWLWGWHRPEMWAWNLGLWLVTCCIAALPAIASSEWMRSSVPLCSSSLCGLPWRTCDLTTLTLLWT
jgi:hypothetical protein